MPLANEAASCLFSPDPDWTIALFFGGREIQVGGYARQPASWQVDGPKATTRVSYGPFSAVTEFDQIAILNGDDPVEVIQLRDGPVRLVIGMRVIHEVIVNFEPEVTP